LVFEGGGGGGAWIFSGKSSLMRGGPVEGLGSRVFQLAEKGDKDANIGVRKSKGKVARFIDRHPRLGTSRKVGERDGGFRRLCA